MWKLWRSSQGQGCLVWIRNSRSYTKFFWSNGILSLCNGVVTINIWLHIGVEVEGFSRSRLSYLDQKFKNLRLWCWGGSGAQHSREPPASWWGFLLSRIDPEQKLTHGNSLNHHVIHPKNHLRKVCWLSPLRSGGFLCGCTLAMEFPCSGTEKFP